MSRPTRSQLESWKPDNWSQQGQSLQDLAETVRESGAKTLAAAQNVEGEGTGAGQQGPESRAMSDEGEISRVAGRLFAAGDALTAAGQDVESIQTETLQKARSFEAASFSVSDDWDVKDVSPVATPSPSDTAAQKRQRDARREEAANGTVSLRSFADAAGEADSRHGQTISEALSELDVLMPPSVGLSSNQAAIDAEALRSGTATQAQRRRLAAATSLSDSQLQALAEGGDAVISKGQMDYLTDLAEELDSTGGLAAFQEFGGRDSELKTHLADGMQILSNPQVRTDELQPMPAWAALFLGPTQYRKGGLDLLPPSWTGPLTDNPVEFRTSKGITGPGGQENQVTWLGAIDDLGTISEVLGHGTEETRTGTDIDRALIARAGDIAGATTNPDEVYTSTSRELSRNWPTGIPLSEIGSTMNSMLEVAGQDEIAVHDAMMTGREGGPSAVSAMPDTLVDPGKEPNFGDSVIFESGKYDANNTMTSLLSFDWDGNVGHSTGMQAMLGVLGDPDTVIGEPGNPGTEATRAGAASGELARIIVDNKDSLVNVEGYGDGSTGQMNPGVSEAAANAVGPHLVSLAGGDASAIGIDGARQLDGQEQMTDLFTVFNMQPDSATSINTHGADSVSYLQHQIGENAERLPDGRAKSTLQAEDMGRITVGMDEGFDAAGETLDHAMRRDLATDHYQKGVQYDVSKSVISHVLSVFPGGGAFAVGADIIGPLVKDRVVWQEPYTDDMASDESQKLKDVAELNVEVVKPINPVMYANLLNGYAEQHPGLRDGELEPYFGDDGAVTVPVDTDDQRDFTNDASDVLGWLDYEIIRGVGLAQFRRDWI